MMTTTHRSTGHAPRRAISLFATIGLGGAMLASLGATAQAVTTSCRATDPSTGMRSSHLQDILDAASPGATINIRGVCKGNFLVEKDLHLVGKATAEVPQATLDGRANGTSVVTSSVGSHLFIKNLLITNGHAPQGGGIKASGPLTLAGDTLVAGNTANLDGGGIMASGAGIDANRTVFLRDSATVYNNSALSGGGIYAYILHMSGAAEVKGNTAVYRGGGIYSGFIATLRDAAKVDGNVVNGPGSADPGGGLAVYRVTLAGSSQVSGNEAEFGGGVVATRVITLKDQASVTGNTALTFGGVYANRSIRACDNTGLDEWTGAITPNTPDDPPTLTPITC